MLDKFSTGNFYIREQGTGNTGTPEGLGNTVWLTPRYRYRLRSPTAQKTIKSSSLPLQGEG